MGQTTPWPDLDPTAQHLIMLIMPSNNPKTNTKFWGLFPNDLHLSTKHMSHSIYDRSNNQIVIIFITYATYVHLFLFC